MTTFQMNLTVAGGSGSTATEDAISFTTTGSYGIGTTRDGANYIVAPNGVYVSSSSPAATVAAAPTGFITFGVNPSATHTITLSGVVWTFVASGAAGTQTNIGASLSATLTQLASDLNASVNAALTPATYSSNSTQLLIVYDTVSLAGQSYGLVSGDVNGVVSNPTLRARYLNGEMKNPERASTNIQALDGGNGTSSMIGYDATKQAAYPVFLSPNDCLLKAKAHDPIISSTREGVLDQAAGLHVVSARKSNAVFAAPYCWPASDLANRPWRVADVDLLLNSLTTFNTGGQQEVTWAQLTSRLSKFNVGKALCASTNRGGYEDVVPYSVSDVATSNYDPYQLRVQALMLMGLMGQTWNTADKTAAAIALLRRGCQEGEAMVAFGSASNGDGGHYSSQYAPCMAWLLAAGRTSQYATWVPYAGINVYVQYYTVTSGLFDPHSVTDSTKPYIARLRNVTAINAGTAGANCQIKTQGFSPTSGLNDDTATNAEFRGLNLVKNVGGNLALINSFTQGASGSDHTFELAAPITGLIMGDAVYGAQVSAMSVGTVDWTARKQSVYPNLPNPSYYSEYRSAQFPAIAHLFVHNIGMSGALMAPSVAYCQRAMASGGALPSMCDTVSNTITGSSNTWASQFYTANAATLLAKTQIV